MCLTAMAKILMLTIRWFWKLTFQTFCQTSGICIRENHKAQCLKLFGYLSTQIYGERTSSTKVPYIDFYCVLFHIFHILYCLTSYISLAEHFKVILSPLKTTPKSDNAFESHFSSHLPSFRYLFIFQQSESWKIYCWHLIPKQHCTEVFLIPYNSAM